MDQVTISPAGDMTNEDFLPSFILDDPTRPIDHSVVGRPSVSWTLAGEDPELVGGVVAFSWSTEGRSGRWYVVTAAAGRAQIPALPASLSDSAPSNGTVAGSIQIVASSAIHSYADFRSSYLRFWEPDLLERTVVSVPHVPHPLRFRTRHKMMLLGNTAFVLE